MLQKKNVEKSTLYFGWKLLSWELISELRSVTAIFNKFLHFYIILIGHGAAFVSLVVSWVSYLKGIIKGWSVSQSVISQSAGDLRLSHTGDRPRSAAGSQLRSPRRQKHPQVLWKCSAKKGFKFRSKKLKTPTSKKRLNHNRHAWFVKKSRQDDSKLTRAHRSWQKWSGVNDSRIYRLNSDGNLWNCGCDGKSSRKSIEKLLAG